MYNVKSLRSSFLETEILKRLAVLVAEEMPEAMRIIVFGSRARAKSDENSDLDVAVIVDVPLVNKDLWDRVWDIKWRILETLDSEEFPLSLSPITLKDFISRTSGLEEAIKTEGILIWERMN